MEGTGTAADTATAQLRRCRRSKTEVTSIPGCGRSPSEHQLCACYSDVGVAARCPPRQEHEYGSLQNLICCRVLQAGTGTWNGPAPRGMRGTAQVGSASLFGRCTVAWECEGSAQGSAERAPIGSVASALQAAAPAAAAPTREPDSVRLSNGVRLPMIGFGTAAVKDPEAIRCAAGRPGAAARLTVTRTRHITAGRRADISMVILCVMQGGPGCWVPPLRLRVAVRKRGGEAWPILRFAG
jgi:hypothetical protein